ncbi:hypothetical protein RUM43_014050 [Polyplax serrata]|uniref:Uncharacterized protein n=1 Tax=Polyplax serrata TaxID=468196 RepID=A0AAN8RS93_POLSC
MSSTSITCVVSKLKLMIIEIQRQIDRGSWLRSSDWGKWGLNWGYVDVKGIDVVYVVNLVGGINDEEEEEIVGELRERKVNKSERERERERERAGSEGELISEDEDSEISTCVICESARKEALRWHLQKFKNEDQTRERDREKRPSQKLEFWK